MTRSIRAIEMDDDDWIKIDQTAYGYWASLPSDLTHRWCNAAYDARPPEPYRVTLDGTTYTLDDDDRCWRSGADRYPASLALSNALTRIWNLEHPDKETEQ